MGITIEITTSNKVIRTCASTIYNTANGAHKSGNSVFVQFFVQLFNEICVVNFLLFCGIRNPIKAIIILSLAFCSAAVKLRTTAIFEIVITIVTTSLKNVTRTCATTINNTTNCAFY